MTMRCLALVGTLLLTGFLTACGTMAAAADPPGLDGTAWVLSGLAGRPLVPESSATLQFAADRVSGSDGCNRYAGPYKASGKALEVSTQLAATQMACPPDVMEQSRAFVAALTGARAYRVVEGRLELLGDDDEVLASFAAQSQSLAGTTWRVTGINNGKGGVASLRKDTSVTLAFSADGRASGSAGCNDFTAGYRADGSTLAFSQAAATRKMCMEPEGVMAQEQQFLAALGTVNSVRIEGGRLELRTATGALAVSAVRAD